MLTTQEPTKVVVPAQAAGRERCTLVAECLPLDAPDPNAKFAWANAICALFAVIGVIGIFQPLFVLPVKATAKLDLVPVLFNPPPPQPPQSQAQNNATTPENSTTEPVATPEVIPAVTPMNAQITFAVPVEGPVRVVAAKYAEAPPAKLSRPAAPPVSNSNPGGSGAAVEFNPTEGDGGTYPRPDRYPSLAQQHGWQGKAILNVRVDVRGIPSEVTIAESSGYRILDNDALEWVKRKWRFPAGPERLFLVPFVYKLNN